MRKIILVSLVFAMVFLASFFLINNFPQKQITETVGYVQVAGQNIKVEIVADDKSRTLGLSGRNELSEGEGMLFIFKQNGKYPFWMKDMNFPIDIIWLAPSLVGDNENLKVVYIKENVSPESYPESFVSNEDASYVLEVSAGFTEKNNLKIGDPVILFTQRLD